MKRHGKNISGLLAARIRGKKRHGPDASAPSPGGQLRLSRPEADASVDAPRRSSIESSSDGLARDVAVAARAMDQIGDRLQLMIDWTKDGNCSCRLSPRRRADIQSRVDRAVADIESSATVSSTAGRPLLDGTWRVRLKGAEGMTQWELPIRSMHPSDLGPDAAQTLASIRSGGRFSAIASPMAVVHLIIVTAFQQVSMQRRQLSVFTRKLHRDLDSVLKIAMENARAAQVAASDEDFAVQTSAISQAHILARQLADAGSATADGQPEPLKLRPP